jgi:hypothetical protein
MKQSNQSDQPPQDRWLDIDEIRVICDLRIMHAKVDELYQIVANLKRRHNGSVIHKYADQSVLNEDIARVDEIYLWFLSLKEQRERHAI